MADDVIVIAGPTASGKTAVAVEVARRIGGEIISMDSRQIYRGMDIGTAKPTAAERWGVPHHGFDLVDPDERFSAGRFATRARAWIDDIRARGAVPILAGGTGFFLRAITHPLFEEPDLDAELKDSFKNYLGGLGPAELRRWVEALDPAGAARVDDRQRLSRLLEVALMTGRTLAWWQRSAPAAAPPIDPRVFVLDLPRDLLRDRIDRRVDAMLERGLVAEVEALLQRFGTTAPGLNATGYIELIPHVCGERTIEEAAALIRVATRRYARRQTTWLRHQLPPRAVRIDATASVTEMASTILSVMAQERT